MSKEKNFEFKDLNVADANKLPTEDWTFVGQTKDDLLRFKRKQRK